MGADQYWVETLADAGRKVEEVPDVTTAARRIRLLPPCRLECPYRHFPNDKEVLVGHPHHGFVPHHDLRMPKLQMGQCSDDIDFDDSRMIDQLLELRGDFSHLA